MRDDALEARRVVWRVEPEVYAAERLKLNLTDEQVQILYSIKNNRRTAVKAHHSLGKTFVAAVALLWWIDCWAQHIGYITAPTWGQALGLTFKQAKRLALANKIDFEILNSGIIRDHDDYRATERFIKALNASNGEGFQGEHTSPILIVVEEAVGVPNYIFDASEGLMTDPRCRMLEIANPTDESTQFGDHCESPQYQTFSFSALDHANIKAELRCLEVPFPGAVRLLWLWEMLEKECDVVETNAEDCFEFYTLGAIRLALDGIPVGAKSPKCFYKPTGFFQGRVLGEFPTEASNKVIPAGWLKSMPVFDLNIAHTIQVGVDVARFGDDRTTIFVRAGSCAIFGKEIRQFDSIQIADAVEDVLRDVCRKLGLPPSFIYLIVVCIDVTGGLGTGPFDILRNRGFNNVYAVNSSESANDKELYKNKRSELWFTTRDRAKAKNLDFSRLDAEMQRKLTKELATPMYEIQSGKKVVEDKKDTKKRLGASPDLADGFNLSFYEVKGGGGGYATGGTAYASGS